MAGDGGCRPAEAQPEVILALRASDEPTADPSCEAGTGPDRRGRRSDTVHFLAYQVTSIAILYTLPEEATGWTTESKENYSLGQWWDNVRHPEWDNDDFFFNYVTHPYRGAAYFVRSRERGYDDTASFWYAAALSASYEFGAEALFERPSYQDLIVTPVGGWLLGRYFMRVREDLQAEEQTGTVLPWRQRFIWTMTDPLGAINDTVDRWFGLDSGFDVRPFVRTRRIAERVGNGRAVSADSERVFGIAFTYVW
jgi:hypothetical protein